MNYPKIGKMYAHYVSRKLAEAGFQKAEWDEDTRKSYSPGFRVEQTGDSVSVYEVSPKGTPKPEAVESRLADYRTALENHGHIACSYIQGMSEERPHLIVGYRNTYEKNEQEP